MAKGVPRPYCPRCQRPDTVGVCNVCARRGGVSFSRLRAARLYTRGIVSGVVMAAKADEAKAARMARELAGYARRLAWTDVDAVVPMPLHPAAKSARGFNQSTALAAAVATALGADARPDILRRRRDTSPQREETSLEGRTANMRAAFAVQARGRSKGLRIVICDDVATSAETMHSAAASLMRDGAKEVRGLVYARAGARWS